MVISNSALKVTSHVGRDVLQSASVFKTAKNAIWEYVANGLQYIDVGQKPIVRVALPYKEGMPIVIVDNGRGMDWRDLQNFFTMHGENIDRKTGNSGRGYFGTGKSAAFGIANTLIVTTVKNGKKSKVKLTRDDLLLSEGSEIHVTEINRELSTSEPNGTMIEICDIQLTKKIQEADVIRYIEGHIARWPNATVFVNKKLCEYQEPSYSSKLEFLPEDRDLPELAGSKLVIKIAYAPIEDKASNGISVFSNGTWYETTLGESAGQDMSSYLFGEVEVPKLSSDDSPIAAFDLSRSMSLNAENAIVSKLYDFLGRNLESVRKELVSRDRERKKSEEQKRLQKEADKIAEIINKDFDSFRTILNQTRAKAVGGKDIKDLLSDSSDGEDLIIKGDTYDAAQIDNSGSPGVDIKTNDDSSNSKSPNLDFMPSYQQDTEKNQDKIDIVKAKPKAKTNRGGFSVEFSNDGQEENRAKYYHEERVIRINLDHPQLIAAIKISKGNPEDPTFKRLAYEVAFCEYAIALAYELVATDEHYMDIDEPLTDVRKTIDRISRAAAGLYV